MQNLNNKNEKFENQNEINCPTCNSKLKSCAINDKENILACESKVVNY